MAETPLIAARNVSKKFCRHLMNSLYYGVADTTRDLLGMSGAGRPLRKQEFWANDDVSFTIMPGECVGLMGTNGAGKTTMLKMLNGLIKPDEGEIKVRGRVGALIALGAGFNPLLTGRENVFINGAVLGLGRKEIARRFDEIVDFAEIGEFIDAPVQSYSSGMNVRLGFAVASTLEPDILLVDEVLAVGDSRFRFKCFERILKLREMGTSIILVSHNTMDIQRVVDRAIILNKGKLDSDMDVARGISRYYEIMVEQDRKAGNVRPGAPRIDRVLVANNDPSKTEIQTGEDIKVTLQIESPRAITKSRVVFSIIATNVGSLNFTASPLKDRWFELKEGMNEITLVLENTPLLQGIYTFWFSLRGEGISDVFHDYHPPTLLEIVGPDLDVYGFGHNGTLVLPHRWE